MAIIYNNSWKDFKNELAKKNNNAKPQNKEKDNVLGGSEWLECKQPECVEEWCCE